MISHTFIVDGMRFISGLFWYPLAGGSQSERAQEIKSLAKEQDFDLYILRSTSTYYVGFAHSDGQARIGVFSAAAVVSKTLELESSAREFIFVSPLPDGHWMYVAQRDGVILPDADKCFPNEDAAKSRLLEDISLGDWSLIIAPDIWGVTGSVERDFVDMLPQSAQGKRQSHKWWKLSPVNPYDNIFAHGKKILLGLVIVAVVATGWAYYKKKLDMEALEEARRLAHLAPPPPPPPPEHPWKSKPDPIALVRLCTQTLLTVPVSPGNWDITGILCDGKVLNVSWRARDYGWIDHILQAVPQVNISGEGKVASLSVPLPSLTIGKDEPVIVGRQRMLDMYSLAQRHGFPLLVTPVAAQSPPPGQAGANLPVIDWGEMSWSVKGTLEPLMVVRVLDGPGFRIDSMDAVWNEGQMVWNLEGKQYVKP